MKTTKKTVADFAQVSTYQWLYEHLPVVVALPLQEAKDYVCDIMPDLVRLSPKSYVEEKRAQVQEKQYVTIDQAVRNKYKDYHSIEGMMTRILFKLVA